MPPTHVFAQGGWWIPSRWTPTQALCLVEFVAGIHMSQDTHWSLPSLRLSKASEKIWQVINSNRHYSVAALAGDYCWHRCRVSSPSFFCISITSMAVSSIFLEPDSQFFLRCMVVAISCTLAIYRTSLYLAVVRERRRAAKLARKTAATYTGETEVSVHISPYLLSSSLVKRNVVDLLTQALFAQVMLWEECKPLSVERDEVRAKCVKQG
jgi:hypothetical protein